VISLQWPSQHIRAETFKSGPEEAINDFNVISVVIRFLEPSIAQRAHKLISLPSPFIHVRILRHRPQLKWGYFMKMIPVFRRKTGQGERLETFDDNPCRSNSKTITYYQCSFDDVSTLETRKPTRGKNALIRTLGWIRGLNVPLTLLIPFDGVTFEMNIHERTNKS
jgi:hypothetical protein